MKSILQAWNWMRILRLCLGIALLAQGIISEDAIAILLGLMLGGMAVANIGCCGRNGCAINTASTNKITNTHDEEVDTKE